MTSDGWMLATGEWRLVTPNAEHATFLAGNGMTVRCNEHGLLTKRNTRNEIVAVIPPGAYTYLEKVP